MDNARAIAEKTLAKADITIGGNRPWDVQIHDERVFSRVLRGGTLALGESYMDGWWDVPAVDEFFAKVLGAHLERNLKPSLDIFFAYLSALIRNPQSKSRASQVVEAHYDLGNDLYEAMLDSSMVYTCAYWKDATTLTEAQEAKLDLVCRKIGLKKGDRVLDIGCGFGSFAKFAAEKYGASVVGITISKEQLKLAQERTKGLSVEIRFQDYRDVTETFDHIVSIGMFEAVGLKNFREYFEVAARCLKPEGFFLLHTIGQNHSNTTGESWINKYIFPNGLLPSLAQLGTATEGLFVVEDLHNFGADYDKTLLAWFSNFDKAWPTLKEKYGDRFYRMWKYYLLLCAGTFRARETQLWQVVLSKDGVPGGYTSVR